MYLAFTKLEAYYEKRIANVLLIASLFLTACGAEHPSSPASTPNSANSDTTASAPDTQKPDADLPGATEELSEFDSIVIDVMAADICVTTGKEWSVSYSLSDKEPIDRLGVRSGTLYVETSFDPTEHFAHDDWFVTVTIPEGTALKKVELETLSGNVDAQNFTCDSASLDTASGDIFIENISARKMELKTISDDLVAANISATNLETSTISGDLSITGELGEAELNSASGDIDVTGSILTEGEIETISSDVALTLNHPISLEAGSTGTITLNGQKFENTVQTNDGVPVKVSSISGRIDITTND